ncbi:cilia- and flagella-associated protein 61-like [Sitophilus oryzae]|uniref:Cilia- and flagella-associated protein 61-like n=1 Tax=Sitophilus oryzae TaxID=7048 RepID=A0A6J2XWR0_SITOR|nr:cilia- and flagella-associated protein 61-like [Sitophilus oryzae]
MDKSQTLFTRSLRSLPKFSTKSMPSLDKSKLFILSPKCVKRIDLEQTKNIAKMVDNRTEEIFGPIESVEEILHTRYLSLGVEDEHNHLVAAITFHNCPNIPAIPPWEWNHWLYNIYEISESSTRDTFWIHLFVFEAKFETIFLKPIIQHVFNFYEHINNIFMVVPPEAGIVECLEDVATKIYPKDCRNPTSSQKLYLITRDSFMLKYKIRRAVEEDNDDLVPLIALYSTRLTELYGEYYIAEILTRHKDSGRQIIVAEYGGCAVAVMILNEAVNYEVLNEEFELAPFNGLRTRNEEDFIDLEVHSQIDVLQSTTDLTEEVLTEKISKKMDNPASNNEYLVSVSESDSEYSLILTTSDLFVFDEEEEVPDVLAEAKNAYKEMEDSVSSYEIIKEIEKVTAFEVDPRLTYVDMMERVSRISTISRMVKMPKFVGRGNAFCIEVAACHPDHQYSLQLVLRAVFECFPERDYCIMSVPSSCMLETWMYRFIRVTPRANASFPYELYVLHKSSHLGKLKCRVTREEDLPEIRTLLSTIPTHAIVLSHVEICLEFAVSPYQCFVILCENHVVGVAVFSEEYNIDYIDAQYDIKQWINLKCMRSGSFGNIESLVLSPIFHSAARYIMSDLHRLSDYKVLFYKYRNIEKGTFKEKPLANLLQWLIPILPRQTPEYDYEMLKEEGYEVSEALQRKDPYALYASTVAHSSMKRLCINSKIVVVGCSNTAYSFLESLLLHNKNTNYVYTFNNVSLVCQNGLNLRLPKKVKEMFSVQKNFITEKYMDMVNLKSYVQVVMGNLSKIDRKEQYIVINDHSLLNYDLLFLMCGEKFQKPLQDYRMPFAENPENVFVINSPTDGNKAIIKLKEINRTDKCDDKIIVYGHFLQAYTCLAALLEFGIPGSKIILVEPFPYLMNIDKKRRHNISVFNDPDIYHAVMEFIETQEIKVYSSFYFINWRYNDKENIVTSVKFESKHKMLELDCQAIFFFYEKSISPKVYQVINQAGLVFDGRLVVDNYSKTNDERIYGAGTLTKYSRKYFAANVVHKFFNRVEIGQKLGQQIRNMLLPGFVKKSDPKKQGWNIHLDIRDRLVPKYEMPIMRYCRLPGGLYYYSVVKPGRRIPLETASSMENYGQVFITGTCRNLETQGFFKLHFNEYSRVETITCLTKFPVNIKNIYCLWGKHEKLLNNLQLRFEMVLITDFFEYFKQPWAYALYHDRFDSLIDELNNLMTSSVVPNEECLITEIIEMYKDRKWQHLTPEQQEEIELKFPSMLYPKIVEQKVLDFIQQNLQYLPMYAHPFVIRTILEGYDKSPLFTK